MILHEIKNIVESKTGEYLLEESRRRNVVIARCLFFGLATKYTTIPLTKIGRYLNKDHATVIHGVKMLDVHFFNDKSLIAIYNESVVMIEEYLKELIVSKDYEFINSSKTMKELLRESKSLKKAISDRDETIKRLLKERKNAWKKQTKKDLLTS